MGPLMELQFGWLSGMDSNINLASLKEHLVHWYTVIYFCIYIYIFNSIDQCSILPGSSLAKELFSSFLSCHEKITHLPLLFEISKETVKVKTPSTHPEFSDRYLSLSGTRAHGSLCILMINDPFPPEKNTCIVIQLHHTVPTNIRCIVNYIPNAPFRECLATFSQPLFTFHVGNKSSIRAHLTVWYFRLYPLQTYLWDTALTSNLFKSSKANEWLQILWFPETKQESTARVDPREPPNLQLWRYQDVVQGCTKSFLTWFLF